MKEIQHCQVLGPFNSGTTLMQRYLFNLYRNFSPDCFPYWKHTLPPVFYSYPRTPSRKPIRVPSGGFPNVLLVCMVRSPYFWVNSILKRPYDVAFLTKSMDMEDRLRCPVVFRHNQRFENITQVWNHYYRCYAEQLEINNRLLYIRLEDLVKDTVNTLQKLDSRLHRRPGRNLKQVIDKISATPSKPHNAHGAVWKKKNRLKYVYESICNDDLVYINQQLDPELMRKFAYHLAWTSPVIHPSPAG